MGDRIQISEICRSFVPGLVSWRDFGDASFINMPLVYPGGAFVTVRLSYVYHNAPMIRVSDSGFAFREIESFGAERSFPKTARAIADEFGVEVGKRSIYVDVDNPEEVERAVFDVSAASHAVAKRIVSNVAHEGEAAISDALHQRLDLLFPNAVEHDGKYIGASSTEWEVTAVAKVDGHTAVFQAVPNYPVSVFKASTAFHDLAALEHAPSLVSVVVSKAEMGKNYAILAQAGRVVEIGQGDNVFLKAVA